MADYYDLVIEEYELELEIEILELENEISEFENEDSKFNMADFFDLVIEEYELELDIAILELETEISESENEDIRTYANPIQCNKCLKVFSSVPTLNFHIKLNHADNNTIKPDEENEENVYLLSYPIQCIICLKTFSDRTTLDMHNDITHGTIKNDTVTFNSALELEGKQSSFILSNTDYNRNLKNNHSEGPNEFLSCERSRNKLSLMKNGTNFHDITLACEERHLRTHRINFFQDFQILNRVKLNVLSKIEDQNLIFQVF